MKISYLDFPELYFDELNIVRKKGKRSKGKITKRYDPWMFEKVRVLKKISEVLLVLSDANLKLIKIDKPALIVIIQKSAKCSINHAYLLANFLEMLSRNMRVFS